MQPSVVIVGGGNMAYHLAHAFKEANVHLTQVYNRSQRGLVKIANDANVRTTTSLNDINPKANIYIVAVSDDGIEMVAKDLSKYISSSSIVAHTSGNQSITSLSPAFRNIGVFYPLQSVKVGRPVNFDTVPIFISSSNEIVQESLMELGSKISKTIVPIDDDKRSDLHIPAVIVNNFVNHLYTLAYEYSMSRQIDFRHLLPLMQETLDRVKDGTHPNRLQTGPAIRKDQSTLDGHLKKLSSSEELQELYQYMTHQIQKYYHENS